MEDLLANIGLWVVLPPELYMMAVKFGNLRQAEAIRRHAKLRFKEETPVYVLASQHIEQAIFEAGTALALGLKNLERLNTDHEYARIDLPDGTGLWPRACKRQMPAYIKGLEKDFGYLVGGRVWDNEEVHGIMCCVVEIRCWADMRVVPTRHSLVDIGNLGAPFYQLFWGFPECCPILQLVERYNLDTSACLPGPPPSISRSIIADYPPPNPEPKQCEDGCKGHKMIPRSVGGFICADCGFYHFRQP